MISERHRRLYLDYHAARAFPLQRNGWLDRIEELAAALGAQSVIDYGCGAARGISQFCRYPVVDYDPGVAGCEGIPAPADLVVSIHALEYVEAAYIDRVLEHLLSLARKAVFLVVSCEPSTKLLPDGSPWHCFVRSAQWWQQRLYDFVPVPTLKTAGAEYAALRLTPAKESS